MGSYFNFKPQGNNDFFVLFLLTADQPALFVIPIASEVICL